MNQANIKTPQAAAKLEPMLCTGCGHDSRDPILPPALACCPDSRYRTLVDFLDEACNEKSLYVLMLLLDWALAFQRRTVALEASAAKPGEGTEPEQENKTPGAVL